MRLKHETTGKYKFTLTGLVTTDLSLLAFVVPLDESRGSTGPIKPFFTSLGSLNSLEDREDVTSLSLLR